MQRRRLESAGNTYSQLRGLFCLPLGALLVLCALANWEWGPFRHPWILVGSVGMLAVLTLLVVRHYDDHYGRITRTTRQSRREAAVAALCVALVMGGSSVARSEATWSLDLPVNGLAFGLAAAFLAGYALTVGLRRHQLVVWGSLLVIALLPVWDGLDLSDTSNAALVLAGVAAMTSGVFDHRLLARTLAPEQLDLEVPRLGA